MSTNFFRKMTSARATRASLEDDKSRTGLSQDINEAQVTADAALDHPPVGAMVGWSGFSDPTNEKWLMANGRVLDRTIYADYFAVCGTTWNTGGEVSTEFRMPDTRGRTLVGSGQGSGLTNRTFADRFGEERHTTTINEMPSHHHGDGTTSEFSDTHSHTYTYTDKTAAATANVASGSAFNVMTGVTHPIAVTSDYSEIHDHNIAFEGGGASHNNMQPSLVAPFIVRVLR